MKITRKTPVLAAFTATCLLLLPGVGTAQESQNSVVEEAKAEAATNAATSGTSVQEATKRMEEAEKRAEAARQELKQAKEDAQSSKQADKKAVAAAETKAVDIPKKIDKAVAMLDQQMQQTADLRIPEVLLQNANCIALIPGMLQGGLGIGGKTGSGLMSCRQTEKGAWGAPVFIRLSGANIGTQIGVQSVDVILLAMTDSGLNQLLAGKPIASGDAGVSVGPIGSNASIAVDVLLQTPLLSYTRSKGLYAGATVGGSVFTPVSKENTALYGEFESLRDVLLKGTEIPAEVLPVKQALDVYAPAEAEQPGTVSESPTPEEASD